MRKVVVICMLVMLMSVIDAEIHNPGTPESGDGENQNPDLHINENVVNEALYRLTRSLPSKEYGRCFGEDGEWEAANLILSKLPNSVPQPISEYVMKWKDDESYKLIIKIVNLTTNEIEQTIDVECFPLIATNIPSVHINGTVYNSLLHGNNSEYAIFLYELNSANPWDFVQKSFIWCQCGFDAFILYDIYDETFFMGPPTSLALPGLSITGYDGNFIVNYIQNPNYRVDAYFKQVNEMKEESGRNVIGTIYGKNHSKYILVSAHHDSWWGECAVDDASGVAEVIGIANAFEGAPQPKYDIKFVTFTGEEYFQIGSKKFNDKEKIYVQINIDMIFANTGTFTASYYKHRFPEAFDYANEKTNVSVCITHGGYWEFEPMDLVTGKAISFYYKGYPYYHRTTPDRLGGDSYDKIDTSDISTEGEYILKIVEWFAYNHDPYIPSDPCPANNSTNIPLFFQWKGGDPDFEDEVKYDFYFGINPYEMQLVAENLSHPWIFSGKIFKHLLFNATYYWKIVSKDNFGGVTEGPVWCFIVENGFGVQNITKVGMNVWTYDYGDGTYDIYVNEIANEVFQENLTDITFYYIELNNSSQNYAPGESIYGEYGILGEFGTMQQDVVADYSYSPSYPEEGEEIYFTDESYAIDGNIVSWEWDFGDGSYSYQQNPTHTYSSPGNYIVTLTVTTENGESSGIGRNIYIASYGSGNSGGNNGNPGGNNDSEDSEGTQEEYVLPNFIYLPSDPEVNETINFYDQTDGDIVSWEWDFGDGSYSYQQNPSHSYSSSGIYCVSLTVTDSNGNSGGAMKFISVSENNGNQNS